MRASGGSRNHSLCVDIPPLERCNMFSGYDESLDYIGLILSDQDKYYEIRDLLREAIQRGDSDEQMATAIRKKYDEKYARFANDLIYDAKDIVEYEARNGLSYSNE